MVCGWPLVRVGDYFCNEKEFGVLRSGSSRDGGV